MKKFTILSLQFLIFSFLLACSSPGENNLDVSAPRRTGQGKDSVDAMSAKEQQDLYDKHKSEMREKLDIASELEITVQVLPESALISYVECKNIQKKIEGSSVVSPFKGLLKKGQALYFLCEDSVTGKEQKSIKLYLSTLQDLEASFKQSVFSILQKSAVTSAMGLLRTWVLLDKNFKIIEIVEQLYKTETDKTPQSSLVIVLDQDGNIFKKYAGNGVKRTAYFSIRGDLNSSEEKDAKGNILVAAEIARKDWTEFFLNPTNGGFYKYGSGFERKPKNYEYMNIKMGSAGEALCISGESYRKGKVIKVPGTQGDCTN